MYPPSAKEEIARVLSIKRTRLAKKDEAIRRWKDLVKASGGGDDLAELLSIVGMRKKTAAGIVAKHPIARVKHVCYQVAGDVEKIPGFIVDALKHKWQFRGATA